MLDDTKKESDDMEDITKVNDSKGDETKVDTALTRQPMTLLKKVMI